MIRLVFQTGGPWHPLDQQAALVQSWLPADWRIVTAVGADAFDRLAEADLFVAAGLHGEELEEALPAGAWQAAQIPAHGYTRPSDRQKDAFRAFVASGRPVLAFHGGIASYADWPEYGRLLGFRWLKRYTDHAGYGRCAVRVATDSHPVVASVRDFTVADELYFNVVVPPEMPVRVHARAHLLPEADLPMVVTGEGPAGRCPGAGKTAFLANGHSLDSMAPAAIRQIWIDTLGWLLH